MLEIAGNSCWKLLETAGNSCGKLLETPEGWRSCCIAVLCCTVLSPIHSIHPAVMGCCMLQNARFMCVRCCMLMYLLYCCIAASCAVPCDRFVSPNLGVKHAEVPSTWECTCFWVSWKGNSKALLLTKPKMNICLSCGR